MDKRAKSFRGETVDFNLFEIKNQILQSPINNNVKEREKLINKKRRRKNKQIINELLANKLTTTTETAVENVVPHDLPEPANTNIVAEQNVLQSASEEVNVKNRKVRLNK